MRIGRTSTVADHETRCWAPCGEARRLHLSFPAMPDPVTSRIPRDALLGLLSSARNEQRITAPMAIAQLDELLEPELASRAQSRNVTRRERPTTAMAASGSRPALIVESRPAATGSTPDFVVRFTPGHRDLSSRQVVLFSCVVTILLGMLVYLIA